MEIADHVQYTSFITSPSSVFAHTLKVCTQVGCMQVLPPGHRNDMCDRCQTQTRLRSPAKRQKIRHDPSNAVNPTTSVAIPRVSNGKARWRAVVCFVGTRVSFHP